MIVDLRQELLSRAQARMDAGDYDAALPLLERLARIARHDGETMKFAHVTIGARLYELGDARSVEHFQAAAAISPADDRVRYCLGHAHLDREQYVEAAEEFGSALALDPGNSEYLRSWGVALAGAGDLDGALAKLRAAQRIAPEEPHVLKDLGQVLAAKGRWEEALRLVRRAVALAPGESIFQEVVEELQHLSDVERIAKRLDRKR